MTRSRRVIVAVAVVMSLLVVAAQPAAASHGLVTVSSHTTDSDFEAGTLTNMTASGGEVTLSVADGGTVDDFEDGGISEYTGDTGDFEVNGTAPVESGSNSLKHNTPSVTTIFSTSGLSNYPEQGNNYTAHTYLSGEDTSVIIFGVQDSSNFYAVEIIDGSDVVRLSVIQSGSTTILDTDSGDVPNDEWLEVEVGWETNDDINVTVRDAADSTVATVDANNGTYTDGGIGWRANQDIAFDNAFVTASTTPGTYISANHTAEDTEQGWVNITENTNATATVTWEGWDGSSWTQLNQTTDITTTGNETFTWSESSTTKVRVNVTVFNASGNGAPEFTFADEGVQFTANDTFVDNGSASPTSGISTATPTLSIDINDSDFAVAQGDEVTVTFHTSQDGQVGTDTLTSNGTASYTLTSSEAFEGGDHTWNVTATDGYGHSVTSQDFSVSTPGNITFRRETPVHEIIKPRQINGTIFGEDDGDQYVMNFTTTDGNVSLTGVPVDERLVVQVEADGYHPREVVIEDVFSQTNMYLLNTSESSVTITFDIQDTTGDFSTSETEFVVQRSINRSLFDSGGFTQEAIAGDRIGAGTEYIAELEQDGRYRVIIRNPGESTRVLGAQVAKETGTIPIRINSVDLEANGTQGYNWSANVITSGGNEFVEFVYVDNEDATTEVDLVIYEYDNASNEIHNQTHTGTYGTLKVTEQLTGADINRTWAVQFDATRSGETVSGTIVIGQDTNPLNVPLDDEWKYRLALISLIVIAFIVGGGVSPEAGGIAIAAAAGLWFYVEWMPPEVTAVAIGFGSLTAVGFAVGKRGGEPVQ